MPITLTYDLKDINPNQRNYVRSMLERYGWVRRGGSTFRYAGFEIDGVLYEDWLNDVGPSLMYLRFYVLQCGGSFNFFTLDALGSTVLDFRETDLTLGIQPRSGADLDLHEPTNSQSSEQRLRDFVDAATLASND